MFLLALLIRGIHLATIRVAPSFSHLGLDPLAYDQWGQRIAGGDWLGHRSFYQDPLYPYFLGILYATLGHTLTGVVALQCLLGSLIPVLVYGAARPWLGRETATVAAILAALYLPSIYYEGLILKTWLGAFLVAAALALLSHELAVRRNPGRGWLGLGLLLGLGCLVRGNLLLFIPCLTLWILLARPAVPGGIRKHGPVEEPVPEEGPTPPPRPAVAEKTHLKPVPGPASGLRAAALLLAGSALVLAPTALRNRLLGGEWVLTTSQGGQNFYLGNNPTNRNGRYEPLPFVGANPKYEEKGFASEARRRTGRALTPVQVSHYWLGQALRWIKRHPAAWLHLTWLKLRNFWGAYEVPDNLDYYLYRRTAPVLKLPLPGFGLVAPLALLGAWLLRKTQGWPRVLLLYAALYSSSVIAFFVFSRYRLAMMPALFPLAGRGLLEIGHRLKGAYKKRGERAAAFRILALALFFMALVNVPVHAPAGYWTLRLARTAGLPVRVESSATGHYNQGLSYAHQADEAPQATPLLEKALTEYRQAIREDPRFPEPYAEMGKVLARLHRNREALEAYRQVILLAPGRSRPHHVLGLLFRRLHDLPSAASEFRQALRLNPRRVDSAVALGQVLLQEGRSREAAEAFRRALDLDPESTQALEG
ncbi:MAG: tetratricopeptide repeat protein, partial [Acidobacteriota bacterium]